MNLLHLKYAIEISRAGSITKAADNLFMGQPNLSKAIRELEESLGITIFRRTSKGVIPTEKGEQLIKYARNIIAQVEEMQGIADQKLTNRQSFAICIPRSSYIAEAFLEFVRRLDRRKEIQVSVRETDAVTAIDSVAQGDCNISVIRYQNNYENYFLDYLQDKQIVIDPVFGSEYMLILPERSPLAVRDEITPCDLLKYIEISQGEDSIPYVNQCRKPDCAEEKGRVRQIKAYDRLIQYELLSSHIDGYMWSAPVPERLLKRYGLVQKKCSENGMYFKDALVYSKNYSFNELDHVFMEELFRMREEIRDNTKS
ncbi:MAG: LysR family transcriptional regulator [Clostridiaceae bacterium]|nr:LysR family transcriptional regulator [Clostridiaceae bacterium]